VTNFEKVKEIINTVATEAVLICPRTPNEAYYAEEICKLFEQADENRLLLPEEIKSIEASTAIKNLVFHTKDEIRIAKKKALLGAQRDLTASIKDAEIRRWQEKHFNDVMAAKKSGYDDAKLECRAKVQRIFEEIDKAIDEESYPDDESQWYSFKMPKSWLQALKKKEGV